MKEHESSLVVAWHLTKVAHLPWWVNVGAIELSPS